MFSSEEFIIAVFCLVDDGLKVLTQGNPVRSRGFAPALSDAEVLTMEIVGEYRGMDADTDIWEYFRDHWHCLFPRLTSRSSFARQAANLWQYKQRLQQQFARDLGAFDDPVHLVDGLPVRLCCLGYASRCQSFQGTAAVGYCAAKKEPFYGFYGHLLISARGIITGFSLTPANVDEREALWDVLDGISGLLIGDKGYISQWLRQELASTGILLQTALRSNMKDTRPKWWIWLLQTVRRLIETVNGQLAVRFHVERVRARDFWHLTSRFNRKLLAHTVCCYLNRLCGRELLQFDGLIAS